MAPTVLGVAEEIGSQFGITAEASRHYFRSSREAHRNYVPAVGRGGRDVSWMDCQVAKLGIAMIGGSPVKSPETIETLGGMLYQEKESNVTNENKDFSPKVEFGPLSNDSNLDFCGQFAHIIEWMSRIDDTGLAWHKAISGLQIEITVRPWIEASLYYKYTIDGILHQVKLFYRDPIPSNVDPSTPGFFYLEKKFIGGPLAYGLGCTLRNTRSIQLNHTNESADAPGRVSAQSKDRSSNSARLTHTTRKENGASTTPNMLPVCASVIPEPLDDRCFLQSSPIRGSHEQHHGYPPHA